MEPLIALVAVTLILFGLGRAGVRALNPWPVALRGGVAAMFTLTGVVHFVGMRQELIAMVPPSLPRPDLLVTVTGVLELAGAAGMLLPRLVPWAAAGLTALLLAMFPANVHKAMDAQRWDDTLVPRGLLQLVFLAATVTVLVVHLRQREKRSVAG